MKSFQPPARILMGPGPASPSARVALAQARPALSHLDPAFDGLVEDLKSALLRLAHAPDHAALMVPGPSAAGAEAALCNLLEPGDVAVVAVNGLFSARMADMAERAGADVVRIAHDFGRPVDLEKAEAALWARGAKLLAFVHAETSTGALSDAASLCALAGEHGAMSVVDCVTSLGGVRVDAAAWSADAAFSASYRCLSAPPGVSPLILSPRALEAIRSRQSASRSWVYDLELLMSYWGPRSGRAYHHSAPTPALMGLHEALMEWFEEGEAAVFLRHQRSHEQLAAGLAALELDFYTPRAARTPQLNAVVVPDGVEEAALRSHLLQRWGLEIGAGLGPLKGRIWRIGLMGRSADGPHIRLCLSALADALNAQGRRVSAADALAAAGV